jgi:hypothetical protein
VQGEGDGEVHGYGAFAHSAFSAYHSDFVLNRAHSESENLLLFQHLPFESISWACAFWRAHKKPQLTVF